MYEVRALLNCTRELREMIDAGDVFGLMFRLRGGISRGRHGLLHPGLFAHAHAGTKAWPRHRRQYRLPSVPHPHTSPSRAFRTQTVDPSFRSSIHSPPCVPHTNAGISGS